MPIARFEMPDGRVARFEVPEGTTPEQAQAEIERQLSSAQQPIKQSTGAQSEITPAERIAGSPVTRFALGAASPFLGAAQLGAEMAGFSGVSDHLKRLDEIKRRGMTPAADMAQLQELRTGLAKMPGYEAAIAQIDRQIASLGSNPSANIADSGADIAGIAGSVLSPAMLAAMKIPAAATVLGRAGQGAAVGAITGASTPVTQGTDDFAAIKGTQIGTGALLGGLIPPAIEGVRAGYQIGRNIIDPILPGGAERTASRLFAEAAKPKRQEIERLLAENKVFVPGSQPTAAEVAAPAGGAEFSSLQNIFQQHKPTAYSDIARSQEAARLAAVRGVGKDSAALEVAKKARAIGPGAEYENVGQQFVRMNSTLDAISKSPAFKAAESRAQLVAENAAKTLEANGKRALPFKMVDPETKEVVGYSAEGLQYIKSVLDDMADNTTFRNQLGISGTEAVKIGGIKNTLVGWMNKNVPGWEKARVAYADASKPINEMQVGQELEKALRKPLGDGERAAVFASAAQEAPKTIKRATDIARFDALDDVLSPESLKVIKDVLADLNRKATMERLSGIGRQKASEIIQPFGLPATGPLHQGYMIFKTILGRISRGTNEKTLDLMADSLQVPSATLKLLRMAPSDKQEQIINNIISNKLGRGAIAIGTLGASEGAQQ